MDHNANILVVDDDVVICQLFDRYRKFEPKLDVAIKEAIRLASTILLIEAALN